MRKIITDLERIAENCLSASKLLDAEDKKRIKRQVLDACSTLKRAWSGGRVGYHARIYTRDLQPVRPGWFFDTEYAGMNFNDRTEGEWAEFPQETIIDEIFFRAGVENIDCLKTEANKIEAVFNESKEELLTLLTYLTKAGEGLFGELVGDVEVIRSHYTKKDLAQSMHKGKQIGTRDQKAFSQGIHTPPHELIELSIAEINSYTHQIESLGKISKRAANYLILSIRTKEKSNTMANKVFIGHGRSTIWKDLKIFLRDRLSLDSTEFNIESAAGMATTERLSQMLDEAVFAFIIMTGEDTHEDGTTHARENVCHELGLFQGKLGFKKAIPLLEKECQEFSNIIGLGQIRFPKGDLYPVTEEIRKVLEREGII